MGWPERLDAMEEALRAAAATVHDGAPPDGTPLPPAGGPLPPELATRARALLEATVAMEDEVRARLAEVGGTLGRLRGHGPAGGLPRGRGGATFVDTRA